MIPTLSLIVVDATYWLVCRIYGWRSTLSARTYLMFFTLGCVGSSLIVLYLQAIPMPFSAEEGTMWSSVRPQTWLTDPAIEEIAKIIPLVLIVRLVPAARRLGIADFTLIGFSTGLGFGFVEDNLQLVLSSNIAGWVNPWCFGLGSGTHQAQYVTYGSPHSAPSALVGLGLGIGVRLWPNRHLKWLPGAAMLMLVTFDHSMWNFKQQHQFPNSFDLASPLIERLYALGLHGWLEAVLLPPFLVISTLLEGLWSWRAVSDRDGLLLHEERGWSVLGEVVVHCKRLRLGYLPLKRALTYFRHRRALGLAAADAARSPGDADAERYASLAYTRLLQERAWIAEIATSRWSLSRTKLRNRVRAIVERHWLAMIVVLTVLLLFGIAPQNVPWLHGPGFAWVVTLATVTYSVSRIARFWRTGVPDPSHSDGEILVSYRAREMLLGASAIATTVPFVALALDRPSLIPGAIADVSSYIPRWVKDGGSLPTLIETGGAAAGAATEPGEEDATDLKEAFGEKGSTDPGSATPDPGVAPGPASEPKGPQPKGTPRRFPPPPNDLGGD